MIVNSLIILTAALVYAALLSPISFLHLKAGAAGAVYKGRRENSVSFRIDLVWGSSSTERILSTLDSAGVKATFALTPEIAEQYPTLISRIASKGHELALTLDTTVASNKDDSIGELKRGVDLIETITGERPSLFCSPSVPGRSEQAAASMGLTEVRETVALPSALSDKLYSGSAITESLSSGAVIKADPTEEFASSLPFLIDLIKNMGLDIVPIHKMLYN